MDKILSPFKQGKLLNTLFLSNVFISFHYALIIYINSSFLSTLFSETQVSALYIISSAGSTILLINASKILEKIGVYKFIILSLIIEIISTAGLALSDSAFYVSLWFIIHTVTISLILFNMDVLIESIEEDKTKVGSIRATYLTLTNITIVIAPFCLSWIIMDHIFTNVYLISCLSILPVYFLIKKFRDIKSTEIHHIRLKETASEYIKNKNLYNILISQFLLQLFYAFMIIYTPIYLETVIGFSWAEIGIIFTIMLLPFILFEVPLGELSDDKYGEKEFLTIGFIVMGLATLFISFITAQIFWMWATILFITRIGASFVEVSVESYFFKQVDKEKTDVISFFRIARPISFIVAPILATIILQFIPFQYLFIFIGTTMILGAHYSLSLVDTR
ncbi:MAG: hypothetical protein AB201_01010 [Parcubacteria bacterium C7867-006]|nr:MAG: hypothetical protein AB201_01010 [Parcubacteria bacterium C7867-006]